MKAVLIGKNKKLHISKVPDPVIKRDEVLVEIYAAGVNRADLLQREGIYPPPAGCPEWMGLEISGIIAGMGPLAKAKSSFKIGDSVCALLGGGGYAEYAAVRYDMLMPVPKGFSFAEAAAIPEAYTTAYLNLFKEAKLKKGETLLIHAGASGVGIATVQMAKAYGAKVIATVRSDEKAKKIKKFGADIVFNAKAWDETVLFNENRIDVVLDCVGGEMLGKCFAKMARYGRWVMIATLGGTETQLDLKSLLSSGTRLIGSTLRSRTPQKKAGLLRALIKEIYPYFESGKIKPEIYKTYPFDEACEAQKTMMKNENIGKIVLILK